MADLIQTKRIWACDLHDVIVCERHASDELLMAIKHGPPLPGYDVGDETWMEVSDHDQRIFMEGTGQSLDCDSCKSEVRS